MPTLTDTEVGVGTDAQRAEQQRIERITERVTVPFDDVETTVTGRSRVGRARIREWVS